MNIIFLDVDGVLNSINHLISVCHNTHKSYSGYSYPFDDKCLYYLKELVERTDAYLVITSTWRKDVEGRNKLLTKLKEYNLDDRIIGYTPILDKNRGEEIRTFLISIQKDINFVILDDDTDMGEMLPFLIKTDIQRGLTYEDILKAEKVLKIKKMK